MSPRGPADLPNAVAGASRNSQCGCVGPSGKDIFYLVSMVFLCLFCFPLPTRMKASHKSLNYNAARLIKRGFRKHHTAVTGHSVLLSLAVM